MRVSSSESKEKSSNETVLIGNDLIRSFEELRWLCNFPQNCVGLISGTIALFVLLGPSCLVGILVMAVLLCINWRIAKCSENITKQELKATDRRMGVLKEVVGNIEQVKFGAWEESYLNLIENKRFQETDYIFSARRYQIVNMTLGRCCPIFAGCATFFFMGLKYGDTLTAAQVFASLAAYNSLRMPLITLPMNLIQMFTMKVTSQRLGNYLDSPEQCRTNTADSSSEYIVQIKNAQVGWGRCELGIEEEKSHPYLHQTI